MSFLARQAIGQLKSELNELKMLVVSERGQLELQYESVNSSWENLALEVDNKEREVIDRITVDHHVEINDFKKITEVKDEEIKGLRVEVACLEESLKNSIDEVITLREGLNMLKEQLNSVIQEHAKRTEDLIADKDRCVKEVMEKLNREHKAEIESIRSRFRLMAVAKIERSPSDTNLEMERGDIKEMAAHEAIISQVCFFYFYVFIYNRISI